MSFLYTLHLSKQMCPCMQPKFNIRGKRGKIRKCVPPISLMMNSEIKLCLLNKREKKLQHNELKTNKQSNKLQCCSARCILHLWAAAWLCKLLFNGFLRTMGHGCRNLQPNRHSAVQTLKYVVRFWLHRGFNGSTGEERDREEERRREGGRKKSNCSSFSLSLLIHHFMRTRRPHRQRSIIWANRVKLQHLT